MTEDMDDLSSDSDSDDEPVMEKCLLGNKIVEIPQNLCEQEHLMTSVLSIDTWNNALTDQHKAKLMKFLPSFPENDKEEKIETLQRLFSGANFRFGNPVNIFFKKLKDGLLVPDVAKMSHLVWKASYRDYKFQQRQYLVKLLQDVLISRKKLLDAALGWAPDQYLKVKEVRSRTYEVPASERTRWRYFTELQEVRDKCGEADTSSEDENYPDGSPPKLLRKYKKQLQNFEASLSPDLSRVISTLSSPANNCDTNSGRFLSKCIALSEITEERFRDMLAAHKQRRLNEEDSTDLDTSSITLEDIIERTNLIKRTLGKPAGDVPSKKKPKLVQEPQDKKPKITPEPESPEPTAGVPSPVKPPTSAIPIVVTEGMILNHLIQQPPVIKPQPESDEEEMDVDVGSDTETGRILSPKAVLPEVSPQPVHTPVCFFSLLRDLFNETLEQKMSAPKLEEKVKTWLSTPAATSLEWVSKHESWCDMVASALKFLAGDYIGILPESFVPYLDYKEKQQQWQWIGAGRDSDAQILALCNHWFDNKDDVSLEVLETSQGSPPPPKSLTDWTVRPTTDEEKSSYRGQEIIRYQNPHKAFTFRVHGYESVVGPVKGVYGKESGVNKAREHSLLVSDRPPFVTILSLVRDAAARLPNGEGTRADICELLKDSQYLAFASDQQIHTVVSGALDRLHYEKDPCVKYDVNRKLWIYLHRNRTEEEFERIHQAQAAAAKAKKAIQKTKTPRVKPKEVPRVSVSAPNSAGVSETLMESSSNSQTLPGQSPRGGNSPRTQGSPNKSQSASCRQLSRSMSLPVQTALKPTTAPLTPVTSSAAPLESSASVITSTTVTTTNPAQTNTLATTINPSLMISSLSQNGGNNSRPSSQGSVQSLPSPKTVIANVNAAQFMGVSQLQGSGSSEHVAMSAVINPTSSQGVSTVEMKPLSPTFVGQPPVLQPIISPATTVTLSTTPSTVVASIANAKVTVTSASAVKRTALAVASQALTMSSPLQGFQTIVIKQDPSGKPSTTLATLPVLTTGGVVTSAKTAGVGSKPVVARLVSGSQMVSLGNLLGSAAAQAVRPAGGPAGTATIRIQGGSFVRPVAAATPLNMLQATQLAATGAKIPRLAVVTQSGNASLAQHSGAVSSQPRLITVGQGQLGVLQTTSLENVTGQEAATVAVASKAGAVIPGQVAVKVASTTAPSTTVTLPSGKPATVMMSKAAVQHQGPTGASSVTSTLPSVILTGGSGTSSPTVVLANQGALKSTQTYVMTAPGSTPTVVMATASQQSVRGATVTPLNVKSLQGIKVIPVPQAMGAGRGGKGQQLLARIITPPGSIAIRPSALGQQSPSSINIVQGIGSVQSVTSQAPQTSKAVPVSLTTTGQPVIVQVQTSPNNGEMSPVSNE